jgi:protein TonB
MPFPIPDPGPIGPSLDPAPQPHPGPSADPVRVGPRFATPASKLRPPYPPEKLEREEEAALRLRLSIDERGRVVSVEPVGATDRAFLEAARRHLIANWRYRPATEDGRPVPSSTVVTLRFELRD